MKTHFITFFFGCVFALGLMLGGNIQTRGDIPSAIMPNEIPLEKIMNQRLGIPNFFRKINQRSTNITIAYLGGSITAGAGASDDQKSYRGRVTSYIRSKLPDFEVKEINAGLGGTGSFLGAFRVKRDCMNAHPDLVFIEFAVNDAGETEKQCVAYLEGIVRQIWTSNPECDIVLIYTATENWFNIYNKAGDLPASVKAHEKVADYYGIPSINVGIAAEMMVENKKWETKDFSLDGVHPTDAGYALYADMIVRSGETALSQWKADSPEVQRVPLPSPISMLPLEPGNLIPVSKAIADKNWNLVSKSPTGYFSSVLESDVPGAELTLNFTGSYLGFFDDLGPDCGTIEYSIDSGNWITLQNFDQWAKNFYRPHCRKLAENLSPVREHTLRLRIADAQPQESKGRFFRPGYFLVASSEPASVDPEIIAKTCPLFPKDGIPEGWKVTAWNDVSLSGPEGVEWVVEDGVLHGGTPRGTWLISEKAYGDFYIEFEFLLPPRGNSGFGIHFPGLGDPAFEGMEIQMCDPRYYTDYGYTYEPHELAGSVYKAITPRVYMYRPEQWNKYQITCVGNRILIVLNGKTVVNADLANEKKQLQRGLPLSERPRTGHLGFQELSRGEGQVMIRNIKIFEFES